jgi:hypothetical protein
MLHGKQIKLQVETIAKVFKLPCIGVVVGGKEGYNVSITKYFTREEEKCYIPCSGYLIAKANGPLKVMMLTTIMEVLTLKQGNKHVLDALVAIIQVVEEGLVNWGTWFMQKLQNKITILYKKLVN